MAATVHHCKHSNPVGAWLQGYHATIIYVAMVIPFLFDNSDSLNDSYVKCKVVSFAVDFFSQLPTLSGYL